MTIINDTLLSYVHITSMDDETVVIAPNVTIGKVEARHQGFRLVNYGTVDGGYWGETPIVFLDSAKFTFINKSGGIVVMDKFKDPSVKIYGAGNLTNDGIIMSTGQCIEVGSNASNILGYNNTIINSGELYGGSNGILVYGSHARSLSVSNSGEIWGDANGIYLEHANGTPVIFNTGVIGGRANSIVATAGVRLNVTNTGTLEGNVLANSAGLADNLVNNGRVIGNVSLGSGNDLYKGTGMVTGTVFGEDGNDNLRGGNSDDRLDGGGNDDLLDGGFGNDTLAGGAGNDVLNGGAGADYQRGGAGEDTYYVENLKDVVVEGPGQGTDRVMSSVSHALAANVDHLTLIGGALTGTGNTLNNLITGNALANTLNGGAGADRLIGGAGNDIYYVDNARDVVVEVAGQGADRVIASASHTLAANVENLTLTGSAVSGIGNTLSNVIVGTAGRNVLAGGLGNDTLAGGAGSDTFLFNAALSRTANVDRITDFNVAADTVQLENAVFKGLANGWLAASAFHTGPAAADAADRVIYNKATGAIRFDADGSGKGAAIQFATVSAGLALTHLDFQVI